MSFVISGPKRFLVLLFYCTKLPRRTQPGQRVRPVSRERPSNLLQSPMNWALPREFRLCRRIGDRVIGMTLIIADSKQLDLLGELSSLQQNRDGRCSLRSQRAVVIKDGASKEKVRIRLGHVHLASD